MLLRISTLAMLIPLAGCTGGATIRAPAHGGVATLRVGDAIEIAGHGSLSFAAIREDSRCRPTVTCIRAGDALVDLERIGPGRPAERLTLRFPEERTGRLGAAMVTLDSLDFATPPRLTMRVTLP